VSRLVRIAAFARNELWMTLRQPRLLLTLVLGPFLVLFLLGVGYEHQLPDIATLVVGAEGEVVEDVDDYLRDIDRAGLDYRGTTDDLDTALSQLRQGDVDLVVVLPDHPLDVLQQDERATIAVHHRSLDPVTDHQIMVAANLAVNEINDFVLESVIRDTQRESESLADEVTAAREELDAIRRAAGRDDGEAVRADARTAAARFDELADAIGGGGAAGRLGLGDRAAETEESLREGADLLRQVSTGDADRDLDDAAASLSELEELVTDLREADPAVAVRPFDVELVNDTPVAVSLDRFFAPGLVALMLQHLAITFAALSLVRERDLGTTELLQVSPATLGERLIGKGFGFLVIGALMAAGLTALVMAAFGVPAPYSWPLFTAVVVLVLLASLGYGYLVAAAARTDSQAVQLSMLAFLTTIFFSGLFMPLERISWPIEAISWSLPATYAFRAMQQLMLLHRPVEPWLLVGLALMAVLLLALARVTLGRRSRPR
jgi:ABC-2 type transport system permease protein